TQAPAPTRPQRLQASRAARGPPPEGPPARDTPRRPSRCGRLRSRWRRTASPPERSSGPLLAQLPDVLGRPALRPFDVPLGPVAGGRIVRGLRLDQVFHDQAVLSEETDPFPIGQLEHHVRAGSPPLALDPVQPEVV